MRYCTLLAALALVITVGLAAGGAAAFAYGDGTPDTDPPAEEIWCDGLGGRLWGLCVAYCEAQDCPASEHPSCDVLRNKLFDLTGSVEFPCDAVGPSIE